MNGSTYIKRLSDAGLRERLEVRGMVLIEGPNGRHCNLLDFEDVMERRFMEAHVEGRYAPGPGIKPVCGGRTRCSA